MPWITEEEKNKAKQVDLLTYLKQYEPQNIQPEGSHDYRHKVYHGLIISDNGLWHWTTHNIGGRDALKYLTKVEQRGYVESVRLLLEMQGDRDFSFQHFSPPKAPASKQEEKGERATVEMPQKDSSSWIVTQYLRNRAIHPAVLAHFKRTGIVYQSKIKGHTNCVFVGRDKDGNHRGGTWRGTEAEQARGEIKNSQKAYPFYLKAEQDSNIVEVYESPIDAMSGASLHLLQRDCPWRSVNYLALGGISPIALDNFLEWFPQINTIRVCLDNDEAGQRGAEKIVEKYGSLGMTVEVMPPAIGKDYNDTLKLYVAEHKRPPLELDEIIV